MGHGIKLPRPEVFQRKQVANSATSYQCFPAQPHPHSILLVFKNYDYSNYSSSFNMRDATGVTRGGRASGVGLRSANSIELPFPKNLTDQTDLRVNGFERDPFTEMIASKVNNFIDGESGSSVENIPGMIQSMGAGMSAALTGKNVMGAINDVAASFMGTDVKNIASAAQYLLRSKLPGDIQKSVDIVTGQTLNPRETLSFEGVNLRTHQFNWELYPSNTTDSERIRGIVNMIKRNSLPEVTSLAGISKAFLQYPSTVDMYLLGVNEDHYIKFKTSMVSSFTVDYGAGGGVAIMKGGKPAGVSIMMSLTELEIQTAHDYGESENDLQTAVYNEAPPQIRGNQQ